MKPGDHVYIGKPSPNKVHWVIERFDDFGMAHLRSPMSGRRAGFYPENLTLHTEGASA
jgi:hypothetical protein